MAEPWMKFYTSDWRADPRLKMCSPAARGMWIEMICLMHEATPYGHLLIHGQTPNEAQLASLTGIPAAELPHLVAELERLGVFSRTREGVIYSRKLVRMASKTAVARKNGKNGGNPTLRKDSENKLSDKGQVNGDVKPQKPDTRSQILREDANASLSGEVSKAVEAFNAAASRSGWPMVQRMTDPRRKSVLGRLRECGGLAGWSAAIERAEASDFLCGRTSKPWGGFGFDWFTSPSNFTKIMEGNYDNRSGASSQPAADDPTLRAIARAARRFDA